MTWGEWLSNLNQLIRYSDKYPSKEKYEELEGNLMTANVHRDHYLIRMEQAEEEIRRLNNILSKMADNVLLQEAQKSIRQLISLYRLEYRANNVGQDPDKKFNLAEQEAAKWGKSS